jgi:hypothetical protein
MHLDQIVSTQTASAQVLLSADSGVFTMETTTRDAIALYLLSTRSELVTCVVDAHSAAALWRQAVLGDSAARDELLRRIMPGRGLRN